MKDYFNIELGTSKKNIFEGYFFNITTDYYSVAIIVGYATGIDKHSFIYINDSKSFKKRI